MNCKKCNRNIPNDARLCPYCATPVTMEDGITQKVYGDTINNLKDYIMKKPLNMNKAKILDWSANTAEQKLKKPKSFYIMIATILITGTLLMVFLLLEGFK